MAIAFVQGNTGFTAGASLGVPYTSPNTGSNFLAAAVRFYNTGAATYTLNDSNGNVWVKAPNGFLNHNASSMDLWYALNCNAGPNTVTINCSNPNNPNPQLAILEYSGVLLLSAFDVSASAQSGSNSTTPNSGNITTAQAVELLIGFCGNETAGGLIDTPGAGWTARENVSGDLFVCDQFTLTSGSYAFNSTLSASVAWGAYIGAFQSIPSPAPSSSSPSTGIQGRTISNFTVTGTNFDAGGTSTLSFSGTGITINSYGTRNATTLVANISIASGASLGARDVIVTNASTFTGTLPGAFTILPAPPPADILVLLPFSKRTTASVVVFACIGIASPAGAQSIPTTATNIGALSLEYAQLMRVYHKLRHQDTANNQADLFAAINLAVTIATSLNTTIQSMTATGDAGVKLAAMQIVAANALTQLLKVQEDEFGTPF